MLFCCLIVLVSHPMEAYTTTDMQCFSDLAADAFMDVQQANNDDLVQPDDAQPSQLQVTLLSVPVASNIASLKINVVCINAIVKCP